MLFQCGIKPACPIIHDALGIIPFRQAGSSFQPPLLDLAKGQELLAGLGIEEFGLYGRATALKGLPFFRLVSTARSLAVPGPGTSVTW